MRGRNTENYSTVKVKEMTEYQGKQHVIMKFRHDEKHVIFNQNEAGRRKNEVFDGILVFIARVV